MSLRENASRYGEPLSARGGSSRLLRKKDKNEVNQIQQSDIENFNDEYFRMKTTKFIAREKCIKNGKRTDRYGVIIRKAKASVNNSGASANAH